jgi:hypothetical protein
MNLALTLSAALCAALFLEPSQAHRPDLGLLQYASCTAPAGDAAVDVQRLRDIDVGWRVIVCPCGHSMHVYLVSGYNTIQCPECKAVVTIFVPYEDLHTTCACPTHGENS